jgi:hypothetical protein
LARVNYSYIKYQKELARKKKKEEKLKSRLEKKNKGQNADEPQSPEQEMAAA